MQIDLLTEMFKQGIEEGAFKENDPLKYTMAFSGIIKSMIHFRFILGIEEDIDPEKDARFVFDLLIKGIAARRGRR